MIILLYYFTSILFVLLLYYCTIALSKLFLLVYKYTIIIVCYCTDYKLIVSWLLYYYDVWLLHSCTGLLNDGIIYFFSDNDHDNMIHIISCTQNSKKTIVNVNSMNKPRAVTMVCHQDVSIMSYLFRYGYRVGEMSHLSGRTLLCNICFHYMWLVWPSLSIWSSHNGEWIKNGKQKL